MALLKIDDVQGHEIPVLSGARETLERTAAVLLEVRSFDAFHWISGRRQLPSAHEFMQDGWLSLRGLGDGQRHHGRLL